MERARKWCRRVVRRFYRPFALREIAKPTAQLLGYSLITDPEVFHPVCFLSTHVFIEYLRRFDFAGRRFLDMGTGSGVVGIDAARRGAIVTACDVNPRAVRLAARNAGRNAVAIEVVESNLFAAIPGRQFDVICFNLPFYAQDPGTPFEHALYGGRNFETIRDFASGCREALAPRGAIIVIFSEDSGRERILPLFAAANFIPAEERTALRNLERFYLVRLERSAASAPPAEDQR